MNLSEFLDFNRHCLVCGEPLTLYAQIIDGPLWKAYRSTKEVYHFEQFKAKNKDLAKSDFFWITNNNNKCDIDFSSSLIYQNAKIWQFFFFFMCKEESIEDAPRENYAINPCKACYYRSSSFFEFDEKEKGRWSLDLLSGTEPIGACNKDEIFAFIVETPSLGERLYLLNLDNEFNKMSMKYYSVSEQEKNNENFEPNILQLDLPMPKVRPNFDLSQREQLISRFGSWILLS
jgi:hypothetical protein